jgi:antitoxin component of RelBE/YafQ-DinJ toxin-antitoxin module
MLYLLIEQERLPVHITHTTSNAEILSLIEEYLQKQAEESEARGSEDDLPFKI